MPAMAGELRLTEVCLTLCLRYAHCADKLLQSIADCKDGGELRFFPSIEGCPSKALSKQE